MNRGVYRGLREGILMVRTGRSSAGRVNPSGCSYGHGMLFTLSLKKILSPVHDDCQGMKWKKEHFGQKSATKD